MCAGCYYERLFDCVLVGFCWLVALLFYVDYSEFVVMVGCAFILLAFSYFAAYVCRVDRRWVFTVFPSQAKLKSGKQ